MAWKQLASCPCAAMVGSPTGSGCSSSLCNHTSNIVDSASERKQQQSQTQRQQREQRQPLAMASRRSSSAVPSEGPMQLHALRALADCSASKVSQMRMSCLRKLQSLGIAVYYTLWPRSRSSVHDIPCIPVS